MAHLMQVGITSDDDLFSVVENLKEELTSMAGGRVQDAIVCDGNLCEGLPGRSCERHDILPKYSRWFAWFNHQPWLQAYGDRIFPLRGGDGTIPEDNLLQRLWDPVDRRTCPITEDGSYHGSEDKSSMSD